MEAYLNSSYPEKILARGKGWSQLVKLLAFDLGATSGRAVIGHFSGEKLTLEEIHRFPNTPVPLGNYPIGIFSISIIR